MNLGSSETVKLCLTVHGSCPRPPAKSYTGGMRILALIAGIALVGAASFYIVFRTTEIESQKSTAISLSDMEIEIVDTPEARIQGLSGRAEVQAGHGMLFVFDTADRYGFWMKDMLVPIDIVWIKDNGEVVGVDASVAPDTFPTVFYAPEPVRYVLEIRAGEAARKGISIGSIITLPGRD